MKGGLISSLNRSVQYQDSPFIIFNCFIHSTPDLCGCQRSLCHSSSGRKLFEPCCYRPGLWSCTGRKSMGAHHPLQPFPHCCLSCRAGLGSGNTAHSPASCRRWSLIWRRSVPAGCYQHFSALNSPIWALQLLVGFYKDEITPSTLKLNSFWP